MTEDRALLRAIAYGDDPDVRPGDRLRALEMLRDLGSERERDVLAEQLAAMSVAELERRWDSFMGEDLAASVLARDGRFPTVERRIFAALEPRRQSRRRA